MKNILLVAVLCAAGCVPAMASTYGISTDKRGYTIDVINHAGRDVSDADVRVTELTDMTARVDVKATGYKTTSKIVYFQSYQQLVLARVWLLDIDVKIEIQDKAGARVFGVFVDSSQEEINGNEYLMRIRLPSEFTKFKRPDIWMDPKWDHWANVWNSPGGRQADVRFPRKSFGAAQSALIVVRIPSDAQMRQALRSANFARLR